MNTTRVLVGHVPVDSGQVFIVDPCYVLDGDVCFDEKDRVMSDNAYSRACAASMSDDQAGQFATSGGQFADAVCTSTGWGDGMYPVYVTYKDGRVASMTVEFMEDEDEDDSFWEDEDEWEDE